MVLMSRQLGICWVMVLELVADSMKNGEQKKTLACIHKHKKRRKMWF